jgi:CBS domain-containing membrane protein
MTSDIGKIEVRELMTPVVRTLRRNDQLTIADELMRAQRIRHLPVLDEDGEVCGVVSQRDLFRGALAKALGYGETAQHKLRSLLLVKEVMSTHVVTIGPHEPLANAARLMLEHKIGCLPVVDAGRLLGILTESDFLALALPRTPGA